MSLEKMSTVLKEMELNGKVRVVMDNNNSYTHICFARSEQIDWFRRFPDVVNVDATHGTNRHG